MARTRARARGRARASRYAGYRTAMLIRYNHVDYCLVSSAYWVLEYGRTGTPYTRVIGHTYETVYETKTPQKNQVTTALRAVHILNLVYY